MMACITDAHRQLLTIINDLRDRHGLLPLFPSRALHEAADRKAQALAWWDSSIWDGDPHTLNGVTADELIEFHGYPANTYSGENLLYGVDTAAEAFDVWFKSPAHLQNMLGPNYTEVGIAGPIGGSWQRPGDVFDVWVTEFGGARTAAASACNGGRPEPSPPPPRPPTKPRKPTVPKRPPPRNERRRRRRLIRRFLRRLRGR